MNFNLKQHLLKSLKKNMRYDGRKLDEFRDISIELGVSDCAEGSARVKIGETEVIAGVKMAVETPYPDSPEKGNLMVNTELLPLSSPDFESGPPGAQAIEIARIVDRGIRESKAVDFEKLCIKKGEKVWSVMIDICSINDAGDLLDASALAAMAALKNTKFPALVDDVVDYNKKTNKALPLSRWPITITVYKISDNFLVDPLLDEEAAFDARITAAIADDNNICAMQKGGEEPLSIDEISKMIDIIQKIAPKLRKNLGE